MGSVAWVSAAAVYLRSKWWCLHLRRNPNTSPSSWRLNPIEQHAETLLCTSHKTLHQETCIVSMLAWVMKWWNIASCFNIAENDLNMWEHLGNAHIYHRFHRQASKLMTETEKSLMTNECNPSEELYWTACSADSDLQHRSHSTVSEGSLNLLCREERSRDLSCADRHRRVLCMLGAGSCSSRLEINADPLWHRGWQLYYKSPLQLRAKRAGWWMRRRRGDLRGEEEEEWWKRLRCWLVLFLM